MHIMYMYMYIAQVGIGGENHFMEYRYITG